MVAEEPGVAAIINMLEMLRMIHATTQKFPSAVYNPGGIAKRQNFDRKLRWALGHRDGLGSTLEDGNLEPQYSPTPKT